METTGYGEGVDTQTGSFMTRNQKRITANYLRFEHHERGALYSAIRHRLGVTQRAMAALLGVSRDAIVVREHRKRLYTITELLALLDISQLSPDEFVQLLREIAK